MTESSGASAGETSPRPCPFCGAMPEVREPREPDDLVRVACRSCGVSPEVFGVDLADALKHWNRRVMPAAAPPALDATPSAHRFKESETDTHFLAAWTGKAYLYPPYWNLTMLRMAGDVVLTVRAPAPEPTVMGETATVRFTREMWREFANAFAKANEVWEATDFLDGL